MPVTIFLQKTLMRVAQMELTDGQKEVMRSIGPLLVIGGPGSGKTTISILKAARIARDELKPLRLPKQLRYRPSDLNTPKSQQPKKKNNIFYAKRIFIDLTWRKTKVRFASTFSHPPSQHFLRVASAFASLSARCTQSSF